MFQQTRKSLISDCATVTRVGIMLLIVGLKVACSHHTSRTDQNQRADVKLLADSRTVNLLRSVGGLHIPYTSLPFKSASGVHLGNLFAQIHG